MQSLIKYVTLSDYMLVPTSITEVAGNAAKSPMRIAGYGDRGWCRCEFFIFSLLAEMRQQDVELYAISSNGALNQYPSVAVANTKAMPSGGKFSNPGDIESVQALEDEARETLGVLEDLKRVQRGFARKVIKDKLVMLSPDKMDQVFHIVVKGGNADALEPSARLMQKINFRALDDATLCEIDKFANECLFPYGDQLSVNLFN